MYTCLVCGQSYENGYYDDTCDECAIETGILEEGDLD